MYLLCNNRTQVILVIVLSKRVVIHTCKVIPGKGYVKFAIMCQIWQLIICFSNNTNAYYVSRLVRNGMILRYTSLWTYLFLLLTIYTCFFSRNTPVGNGTTGRQYLSWKVF